MKKLVYGGLFLALVGIGIVACEKNLTQKNKTENLTDSEAIYSKDFIYSVINEVNSVDTEKANGEKWRKFWRKVGDWFNDHSGVHMFGLNCNLGLPCGDCPGLCFRSGFIESNHNVGDTVTSEQYSNGFRAYGLDLVVDSTNNEEFMLFTFNKDVNDFVYDNNFYIPEDVKLSNEMAVFFGKNSIELQKGKYEVVYDNGTKYHYSVVSIICD